MNNRTRLGMERLEDRVTPVTTEWTFTDLANFGSASNGANWSNGVPDDDDIAIIPANTGKVDWGSAIVGDIRVASGYNQTMKTNGLTILNGAILTDVTFELYGHLVLGGGTPAEFLWDEGLVFKDMTTEATPPLPNNYATILIDEGALVQTADTGTTYKIKTSADLYIEGVLYFHDYPSTLADLELNNDTPNNNSDADIFVETSGSISFQNWGAISESNNTSFINLAGEIEMGGGDLARIDSYVFGSGFMEINGSTGEIWVKGQHPTTGKSVSGVSLYFNETGEFDLDNGYVGNGNSIIQVANGKAGVIDGDVYMEGGTYIHLSPVTGRSGWTTLEVKGDLVLDDCEVVMWYSFDPMNAGGSKLFTSGTGNDISIIGTTTTLSIDCVGTPDNTDDPIIYSVNGSLSGTFDVENSDGGVLTYTADSIDIK